MGVFLHFVDNLVERHRIALLVLGVAERAIEVASRESNEYGRDTGVESFTLNRIKNFVNLPHNLLYCFQILVRRLDSTLESNPPPT